MNRGLYAGLSEQPDREELYYDGTGNLAIGYLALNAVTEQYGTTATQEGANNVAIGDYAGAAAGIGYQNVFMGVQAGFNVTNPADLTPNAAQSVIIGYQAANTGVGNQSVYLGALAVGIGNTSVIIGYNVNGGSAGTNVAIGSIASTNSATGGNVAVGYSSSSLAGGVAVGASAGATSGGVGVGNSATGNGSNATAVGNTANASASNSTAIGENATAGSISATAIGGGCSANSTQATAVGFSSLANTGTSATALGYSATASAATATALGASTSATGTSSTALGTGATTSTAHEIALGTSSETVHFFGGLKGTSKSVTGSATYSMAATDFFVYGPAGAGAITSASFTVTLPAPTAGAIYRIKNVGTGTLTVSQHSAETIDGASTVSLSTQYEGVEVQADAAGTNWYVVGQAATSIL